MYKIYKLYWRNKRHFPLSLPYTTHYALFTPKSCPTHTQNPMPTSSRESLETLESPDSVYHKNGFDKIRSISQSLIATDSKALFKEKYEEDRAIAGESKVLPRLWWRVFEGVWCSLPLVSEIEVRILLKASGDKGSKALDSNQVMEKRNGQECSVDEGSGQKEVERTIRYMFILQRLRG